MSGGVGHRELDRIFGPASTGDTWDERALTSDRLYVRGQAQVADYRAGATGLRMNAAQVLHVFGLDALRAVVDEGSFQITSARDEPAKTLRDRRKQLGLNEAQLARAAALTAANVAKAETPGQVTPIRDLQRLGQTLALDEQVLGFVPGAGGDEELGVRLRTLSDGKGGAPALSPTLVLQLAEAAWVIAREDYLADALGDVREVAIGEDWDDDYHSPVYEKGYRLAELTRMRLGLSEHEPVRSVRNVLRRFGMPLVQAEMGTRFAGATVANGQSRGIVLNTQGYNENVWVRRMTASHELGHILWDPPARLGRVRVDTYEEMQQLSGDQVEARANAFAIAFLAPPRAVEQLYEELSDHATMIAVLMDRYGVSFTAARLHLANVVKNRRGVELDLSDVRGTRMPGPVGQWLVREDWTNDYYPVAGVPISRRGTFGARVARAVRAKLITLDVAAAWLRCKPEDLDGKLDDLISLAVPTTA
ncbi:ImmA/IrrE family metallo-endopeptidase [Sphingomonas sp. TREG-RG-20F-R18-01]|uniref:ImmA/IrrE family metallo-endopeptidase n=1 Tax=Sphingomonas sp. TREG-RG-20F-R18-01 TaxID=2914982 RepID=UPI001F5808A6|nr:ImmA/IrrE family metallo-endopeptidase [Sphingomonas sp. TREG-RG-20F-R18-01]